MRIENQDERQFYEIECAKQNWGVRQLQRQYNSSLYERLEKFERKEVQPKKKFELVNQKRKLEEELNRLGGK